MHSSSALPALAAVLAALPATQAGLYTKNSPVLQLNAQSYERLIAKSNYTSIVEFYAPWCGHCKNLQPAYEKAAKNLDGLAKVAAVDCDDEANKPFCGSMGVQGFPTLKIVRPSKKGGKPVVEDYNGPRTASGIVESVASKINNHVTRVTDKDLDAFLEGGAPKAILFTEKGTTSALLRSIAIDFLDVISVAQVRDKETDAVAKFGIDKFPTLVLVPAGGQDPIVYDGELNKKDMVDFLKQAGEPNPDPKPAKSKGDSKDKKKKASQSSSSSSSSSSSNKPGESEPPAEPEEPVEPSTAEATAEAATPTIIPIATVTETLLAEKCLQPRSHTCVLAFVPSEASEAGDRAVESLSHLNTKYIHGKRHTFPFFAVPSDAEGSSALRKALELGDGVELIALNARRGWWRQYAGDFGVTSVEAWIDAMRMGEGEKKDLPKEALAEVVAEETSAEATAEASAEASAEETSQATEATDPEPEAETGVPEEDEKIKHEEL